MTAKKKGSLARKSSVRGKARHLTKEKAPVRTKLSRPRVTAKEAVRPLADIETPLGGAGAEAGFPELPGQPLEPEATDGSLLGETRESIEGGAHGKEAS